MQKGRDAVAPFRTRQRLWVPGSPAAPRKDSGAARKDGAAHTLPPHPEELRSSVSKEASSAHWRRPRASRRPLTRAPQHEGYGGASTGGSAAPLPPSAL